MVVDGNLDEKIRYWTEMANKEYGLTDKNETTYEFYKKAAPISDYIFRDDYVIWAVCSKDMWGKSFMSVLGFYIKPESRSYRTFKKLQEEIISLAKSKKIEYVVQGSHFNDKLHRVLGKMGYRIASMRRDI